jgi:hypothetical protein
MKRHVRGINVTLFALLLVVASAPHRCAAEECVSDELGVSWLAGTVISTSDRGRAAIGDATVELFARGDLANAIETAHTAHDGKFVFPERDDGRYLVRVSRDGFVTFAVPVRLRKIGTTPRTLLVNLGGRGVKPCGGGWAKIVLNAL